MTLVSATLSKLEIERLENGGKSGFISRRGRRSAEGGRNRMLWRVGQVQWCLGVSHLGGEPGVHGGRCTGTRASAAVVGAGGSLLVGGRAARGGARRALGPTGTGIGSWPCLLETGEPQPGREGRDKLLQL